MVVIPSLPGNKPAAGPPSGDKQGGQSKACCYTGSAALTAVFPSHSLRTVTPSLKRSHKSSSLKHPPPPVSPAPRPCHPSQLLLPVTSPSGRWGLT